MTLFEIVSQLESHDDTLCIVAKRPWSKTTEAKLVSFTEDYRIPEHVAAQGFEYFLEVSVALDEVLHGVRAPLSKDQRYEAVQFYAENDAFPQWLNELRQS
jgi:hypothetical protein